ncbi:carbon-monoxide dehydrogenase small subunit [Amycolatopsis sulphurea]|uniref:Carbon-monoxide dehydrogenase small subunit n=1 Tax=Amycolatopsis sulphurea TaxID=76022 RepID=A0A2A9FJQ6_9PSEU|nr:(2Fe-2S)-binding protein [Amycolatopsis sulphurea]PFG50740.1 carbon-monoxide dehydrogenase small subunit [Amycolatopsis sulphurea]
MTGTEPAAPGRTITVRVNGVEHTTAIEDRDLLVDAIRKRLGLTGTHVGCYNGDCGACTIMLDGKIVKSCLMLAASADGAEITTIEGFSGSDELDEIQEAFWAEDGFQCGYCLPGQLFAARDLLEHNPDPSEADIRQAISGNICRCTGYVTIVKSVQAAAQRRGS